MSDSGELEDLESQIARRILGAPPRPKLRLITTADLPPKPGRTMSDDERVWACDEIRMWFGVYPIEPYARRRMKGYALLEEMPDDELRTVLQYVTDCVKAIRDEVPFDEAGLL
ncbi:hypothetical protein [Lysobacter sp. HA35]